MVTIVKETIGLFGTSPFGVEVEGMASKAGSCTSFLSLHSSVHLVTSAGFRTLQIFICVAKSSYILCYWHLCSGEATGWANRVLPQGKRAALAKEFGNRE